MAEKTRQDKKQIDPMTQDIIRLLGLSQNEIKVQDLNHCTSQEEMEFELFSAYMQDGMEEETAKIRAMEEAEDIWEAMQSPESS